METTVVGSVLVPLGIILLFTKLKYSFYLLLFFCGFTATNVIRFVNIDFNYTVPYYIATIIIIKYLFILIKRKKVVRPNVYLSIFIGICFLSLIMPVLLSNQHIIIHTPRGLTKELSFSSHNVTQFAYIMFCFSVYWITKDIVKNNLNMIERYINIYFLGAFAICLIGFYQLIAYNLNLPFDEIFRTNSRGLIQGTRVYAVALEPSMLAYYVGPTLALLIFYRSNNTIINKDILIVMLLALGVLSTSTTFILNVIVFILIFIYRNLIRTKFPINRVSYLKTGVIALFVVGIIIGLLISFVDPVHDLFVKIFEGAFDKITINNFSGIERLNSAATMFNVFVKSPILGVGFGSTRSTDLITTWLANIGILGMSAFVVYAVDLYRTLDKQTKFETNQIELCEGYIFFIVLIIASTFVSVPEPYYLFIWINFAICEAYIGAPKSLY